MTQRFQKYTIPHAPTIVCDCISILHSHIVEQPDFHAVNNVCQSVILNHSSKHNNKNATSKTSSDLDHLIPHFFVSIFQLYFYLTLLQFAQMRLGQRFDDPLSSILPSVLKTPDTIHHFARNLTDGHINSERKHTGNYTDKEGTSLLKYYILKIDKLALIEMFQHFK